ncbi:MAG: hypothetical protein HYU83_01895 [Chloroflexi bacterium]|nr:hypothetical protein [Chloroflexota bacterium]
MPLKSFKFDKWEMGGALGDLGTLLPLTLNRINPASVFLVVGLTHALSGLFQRSCISLHSKKSKV